jgi:hypothetical protein
MHIVGMISGTTLQEFVKAFLVPMNKALNLLVLQQQKIVFWLTAISEFFYYHKFSSAAIET